MRGQGRIYLPPGSQYWRLDYHVRGVRHRESSHTASKRDALELLRRRLGERTEGKLIGHPDRLTMADLRAGLERHYAIAGNTSLVRARQAVAQLERVFPPETRALTITKAAVSAYLTRRLAAGAAPATVRYEVAILNTMFSVAVADELLSVRPVFQAPKVENTRTQSVSQGDFAALLLSLAPYLRPVIRFLGLTGWRKAEATGLTWDAVDWEGAVLRLDGRHTKSGKPRTFPFRQAPELTALLEEAWQHRDGVLVFHKAGAPLGDFRKAWDTACRQAGLAGLHVHDLRRAAAQAFRRAGVSEGQIMKLCGWETRAMFDRYNIVDEADLAEGAAKRFAPRTVTGLSTGTVTGKSLTPA